MLYDNLLSRLYPEYRKTLSARAAKDADYKKLLITLSQHDNLISLNIGVMLMLCSLLTVNSVDWTLQTIFSMFAPAADVERL